MVKKNNAGLEAIKKIREKREEAKEEPQAVPQQEQGVPINVLHDNSVYRANLLNHLFSIDQTLKKLLAFLEGEETEE